MKAIRGFDKIGDELVMADKKKDDMELSLKGCYGEHVSYDGLFSFLEDAFQSNRDAEAVNSDERFATCVWGHSGIGKTSVIKQHCKKPVVWNNQKFPGYSVFDVPIAQFEEMGDLHGMPSRHIKVAKAGDGAPLEQWVPEEVHQGWLAAGWQVVSSAGVRTMYAPTRLGSNSAGSKHPVA